MEILTQMQFAERFGTSRQAISQKIRGKKAQLKVEFSFNGRYYRFKKVAEKTVLIFIE